MRLRDPFCDRSKILDTLVYETRSFYLVYDIKPVLPGHTLVIPKRHIKGMTELSREEMGDLWKMLRKAIPILTRRYRSEGSYNMVVQAGKFSGRSIPHLHMHLVPRHRNDRFRLRDDKLYVDLEKRRKRLASRSMIEHEVAGLRGLFGYSPVKARR